MPAAAVIPAPGAYVDVVAVKTPVVECSVLSSCEAAKLYESEFKTAHRRPWLGSHLTRGRSFEQISVFNAGRRAVNSEAWDIETGRVVLSLMEEVTKPT